MSQRPPGPGREALLWALQDSGVQYVVIGGAALEAHNQPHRTDDIDIVPDAQPQNLDRLATALNKLDCKLITDVDDPSAWVALPNDYFTATTLMRAEVWNLHTTHGALDITFHPSGFPGGYDTLQHNAEQLPVDGTSIIVPVASLNDIEHSKRTADRPKDREYLTRVGRLQPPRTDAH